MAHSPVDGEKSVSAAAGGTAARWGRLSVVHQEPDPAADSFIRRVLIVVAVVSLVLLLWELRGVLMMLAGAIVVATVFRTAARPLWRSTGMPEAVAVPVTVVLLFAVLGALGWLFGAQLALEMRSLSQLLPGAWEAAQARLEHIGVADEVGRWIGTASAPSIILPSAATLVIAMGEAMANALVIIFGGIFLAVQPAYYRTGTMKLLPKQQRPVVGDAIAHSRRALRLWLKAQLISMAVVGALTGFGLWLIGMPFPAALGALSAVLEFVPYAGPTFAALIGVVVALSLSPELALSALAVYFLVQQVEGLIIYPLLQQYAVELPPAVLLFSLIAFTALFGTIGLIFAAPLTVVTYVLVKRLYVAEVLDTPTPIPGDDEDP